MEFYVFIIAWIAAILFMTGFSALISYIMKQEFREHLLLTQLLNTLKKPINQKRPSVASGWIIHFAMGLFFMAAYEILWTLTYTVRTLEGSIFLGMGMGIIGILGWVVMFALHPHPPKLHFKMFYFQLFFAHIVFSITAFTVYWLFQY